MWLLQQIGQYLFWFFSALKKFFGITTLPSILAVTFILVSTVAQTFAFFLPLKVVLLLGSDGVPDYFKVVFGDAAKNDLIAWLSISAVGFYLFHLLADYLAASCVGRGADRLMQSSKKIVIYSNQKLLAEGFYGKMCSSIAAALFVLIAILVGLKLDMFLFLSLLVILLLLFVLTAVVCSFDAGKFFLIEHYQAVLVIISGVCFLFLFGVIVFSALVLGEGNLVFAIVNLMLGRQMLQRLVSVFRDGVFLSRSRVKFNSLFYVDLHYQPNTSSDQEKCFSELCHRDARIKWLKRLLPEGSNREVDYSSFWHELGMSNLVGFAVFDSMGREQAFIKISGPGREGLAEHEKILLESDWAKGLPAPCLREKSILESFDCLVFDEVGEKVAEKDLGPAYMSVLASIWSVEPDGELVNKYARSRPMIGDRLTIEIAAILYEVANTDYYRLAVESYVTHFTKLKSLISDLPLCIYNPDLNIYLIYQRADSSYISPHWGRWGIEPIGFGWRACDFEFLGEYLSRAKKQRPQLTDVTEKHVKMVALLSQFELHLKSHSYVTAVLMLPEIMNCLGYTVKDQ